MRITPRLLAAAALSGATAIAQITPKAPDPTFPPYESPMWQPLPTPVDDGTRPVARFDSDFALEHDVATGETRRLKLELPDHLLQSVLRLGHAGASDAERADLETGPGIAGMSALSEITNTSSFPWRMNAKAFITWSYGNYVGSAALIDPYHVLTAGHVVVDPQQGAEFPRRLRFVPGYRDGVAPFGSADAVSYLVWPGWSIGHDLSLDIAVVRLDRPIGALTGWYGIGRSSDCSTYTSGWWMNGSYPGEAPYDGTDLYFRSGTFDSCPSSTESRFDQFSWGGSSGSAFYRFEGSQRIAHGVMSHRNSNVFWTNSDVCRFWPSAFSYTQSWMDATRPSQPDLTPLQLQLPPDVARLSTSVRDTTVILHNHSDHDFDGMVSGAVYLSRNRGITTDDHFSGFLWQHVRVPAMRTATVRFDCWMSGSIPPGLYYAGLILATRDGNMRNQHTLPDDTDRIFVY